MAKRYLNKNKKSPRYKQHFTIGEGGSHVYQKKGGKRVVIGGKKAKKSPYDPLQPLTGKAFGQEVNRVTDLKYRPQEQELASQQRIQGVQTQRTGDYYDQYRNMLAGLRQQTQQAYQGFQNTANQQANTASTQDEAARAKAYQQSQESAKLRGAVQGPDLEGQQAAASRRAIQTAGANLIGQQGATQYGYRAGLESAAGAGKLQALGQENARSNQLSKAQRELTAEKGDFKVQARGQLRDTERTYALNQAAYNLNVAKEANDTRVDRARINATREANRLVARDKKTKNRLTKRNQRSLAKDRDRRYQENVREHGRQEADRQWKRDHPSKGGGKGGNRGWTPANARGTSRQFSNAVGRGRGIRKKGFDYVYQAIINSTSLPDDLARAAAMRAIGQYPSNKAAKKLYNKYGVKMKSRSESKAIH